MTPVTLDDLHIDSTADGVILSWRLPTEARGDVHRVVVERSRHAEGPYAPVSAPLRTEPLMSWRDADVQPNCIYWYRLGCTSDDGEMAHVGPIRIETQGFGGIAARLRARDPGPGRMVEIRYELAHAADVRLEIFDARGRAVRRVESGPHGPGAYLRSWDRHDADGRLAPRGVYFVHLDAGVTRSSRRLVLLSR